MSARVVFPFVFGRETDRGALVRALNAAGWYVAREDDGRIRFWCGATPHDGGSFNHGEWDTNGCVDQDEIRRLYAFEVLKEANPEWRFQHELIKRDWTRRAGTFVRQQASGTLAGTYAIDGTGALTMVVLDEPDTDTIDALDALARVISNHSMKEPA